jgi:hypothetical protein
VRWSTGNASVARVGAASGRVEPQQAGTVRITASAEGGRRDDITLTIVEPRVGRLDVSGTRSMTVGDTATLAVSVQSTRRRPMPSSGAVWSSSDPSKVAVDASSGRLQALAPGRAQVHAQYMGVASAAHVLDVLAAPRNQAPEPPEPVRPQPDPKNTPPQPDTPVGRATPPAPDPALLAEAARTIAVGCRDAYMRRDESAIRLLNRGAAGPEAANLQALLGTYRDGTGVQVAPVGGPPEPVVTDATASVPLQLRVSWRNLVGAAQSQLVTVIARLERDDASWRLVSCRVQRIERGR